MNISKTNRAWAERVADLLNPAGFVREWWTDRDAMTELAAKRADAEDRPCHLFVDDGSTELVCITVQRVPRA